MNTKYIVAALSAAFVVTLASPAQAGLGGGLGGGLNGNLSGFGRGIGGTGSFASQGQVTNSLGNVKAKPVVEAAKSADGKVQDTAKSAVASGADVGASASAMASTTKDSGAVSAMSNVAKPASDSAATAPSKVSPKTMPQTTTTPKPSPSAGLSGSTEQSVNAGSHAITGGGSLDAQHFAGANSANASGTGSLN
jgi:hypothetical protein